MARLPGTAILRTQQAAYIIPGHTLKPLTSQAHILLALRSRVDLVLVLFVDVQQTDSNSFGGPATCHFDAPKQGVFSFLTSQSGSLCGYLASSHR